MQGHHYRVKAGDSLSSIAKSQLGNGRRWPRIFASNRKDIRDPDRIRAGQVLLIPAPDRAADRRHPRQMTLPRIAAQTTPAPGAATGPAAPHAHSPSPAPSPGLPAAPGGGDTTVNSFPFKYKLDMIPKQTLEGPNYTATMTFDGTVVIWLDKQIPAAMITNKGAELTAKHETDAIFAKLVQSQKISWEPGSNKATYENMLTINAHGAPPSLASVGLAVATDNPIPAMRFKFTTMPLQGRLGQHLFLAENFTVVIDLRPKGQDLDNTRQPEPVRVPVYAPVPIPEGFWQRAGHFVSDHKVEIGVGVVVTAVLVSNFLTAGADAELDPAVLTWAARTLQGARTVAPVLAH